MLITSTHNNKIINVNFNLFYTCNNNQNSKISVNMLLDKQIVTLKQSHQYFLLT